jgi:hypothetical protein
MIGYVACPFAFKELSFNFFRLAKSSLGIICTSTTHAGVYFFKISLDENEIYPLFGDFVLGLLQ